MLTNKYYLGLLITINVFVYQYGVKKCHNWL